MDYKKNIAALSYPYQQLMTFISDNIVIKGKQAFLNFDIDCLVNYIEMPEDDVLSMLLNLNNKILHDTYTNRYFHMFDEIYMEKEMFHYNKKNLSMCFLKLNPHVVKYFFGCSMNLCDNAHSQKLYNFIIHEINLQSLSCDDFIEKVISIEVIRKSMEMLNKYIKTGDFLRYVITPCINDINIYSDIQITYTTLELDNKKSGRNPVNAILFKVKKCKVDIKFLIDENKNENADGNILFGDVILYDQVPGQISINDYIRNKKIENLNQISNDLSKIDPLERALMLRKLLSHISKN